MKHVKVLERVYEPRRLRKAWQQVKQNAGAAGIDQGMIFLHDFTKKQQSLELTFSR
ncbi:MAG: hypothetical protein JRJ25_07200 [Deltaproteobacteria bacterium]|nr:hypothetical protein [Deltaproteobacteria bacterium]